MFGSACDLDSAGIAALAESLAQVAVSDGPRPAAGADGARELLNVLEQLERLKAAAAAAQVRATVAFTEVAEQVDHARREKLAAVALASGADDFTVWRARNGRTGSTGPGVAAQVGLARRLSPHRGAQAVSSALVLTEDLPRTLATQTAGVLSEERAAIVVRETRFLPAQQRRLVDQEVAGDPGLGTWGNRELESRVRAAVYRIDPHGATDRMAAAAADRMGPRWRAQRASRGVSVRPKPEGMCRVSALLPLAQGVATYAALRRDADSARTNPGEDRSGGQLMADLLVARVTGQAAADAVPVEVQVVISDSALFGSGSGKDDPGYLPGYGPVPSGWVRDLIRGSGTSRDTTLQDARVWLRRLYATPDSGQLVAMESGRRLFSDGLRRFLVARDKTCRTPWCDAPIRHADLPDWLAALTRGGPVRDHVKGGPTSAGNGQGTCVRCNHTKQHPGFDVTVQSDGQSRAGPHRTRWRTPLGRTYDSSAPPLLYSATPRYPGETYEPSSPIEIAFVHGLAS